MRPPSDPYAKQGADDNGELDVTDIRMLEAGGWAVGLAFANMMFSGSESTVRLEMRNAT